MKKHKKTKALSQLMRKRDKTFKHFPFVVGLMGTFGVVAIFYGFNHLLQKTPILSDNPWIDLLLGILILLVTGTLYKRLG